MKLTFQTYASLKLDLMNGNPQSISRSVNPRYLGLRNNKGTLSSKKVSSASTTSTQISGNPYRNMSFQWFVSKYSHLYRGKFKGRGTYRTDMSRDWYKLRKGL